MFDSKKCVRCEGKMKDAFSFCPYCGLDLRTNDDARDFGMLGKSDGIAGAPLIGGGGMGISDKMIGSIFNSLMKNLEKQMKNVDFDKMDDQFNGLNHEVQRFPNGIKIRIGGASPNVVKKKIVRPTAKIITNDQVERMAKLPRGEAKSDVRRFSDKIVYELGASGVEDVNDIFVSKLESGYEVKAIGKKKVYVNSLPVNLPLKKYFIKDNKLHVEFGLQ
jgi:hypothetical protein